MTFSDNSKHVQQYMVGIPYLLGMVLLFCACWAPEVEPPAPKLSPVEIRNLPIASASAEILQATRPSNEYSLQQEKPLPPSTENLSTSQTTLPATFPFKAALSNEQLSIHGHGGGIILSLDPSKVDYSRLQIDVLELKSGRYRIRCAGCSATHPFQAGWIDATKIIPLH